MNLNVDEEYRGGLKGLSSENKQGLKEISI
jgi:hypothetical protein